jgi:hypothetical protein
LKININFLKFEGAAHRLNNETLIYNNSVKNIFLFITIHNQLRLAPFECMEGKDFAPLFSIKLKYFVFLSFTLTGTYNAQWTSGNCWTYLEYSE